MIALLGKRDTPVDGVEDYCIFLAQALEARGAHLKLVRVDWEKHGWIKALRKIQHESSGWGRTWVLLQYTSLAWSRHGFPFGILAALVIVQLTGACCVVVFHEPVGLGGPRWIDRIRGACQNWVIRMLHHCSSKSIVTAPLNAIACLPDAESKALFIPIGANIHEHLERRVFNEAQTPKIVAVFSVTSGRSRSQEVRDIALAVGRVKQSVGQVRLEVFGRGAEEARQLLERATDGTGIDLRIRGVIPAEEITRTLVSAHALLCVRGLTTSRRGTSIAGIACGLPLVGYGERGSDPAIDSAGVFLVPWHNPHALAGALVEILTNGNVWQEMHERSLRAMAKCFSWDAVAARYIEFLTAPGLRP